MDEGGGERGEDNSQTYCIISSIIAPLVGVGGREGSVAVYLKILNLLRKELFLKGTRSVLLSKKRREGG